MIVGDNQISFGLQGSLGVIKEGCTHFLWTLAMFASALCTVEVSVWDGEGKEEGSKDLSVAFFHLALTRHLLWRFLKYMFILLFLSLNKI